MSSTPWMKFYPSDWRADPALRTCGLAARGLWMEMLSVMHEAAPRGHMVVNGRPVTNKQLAALVGATCEMVDQLLSELEDAGVFSRKKSGVIYSRRMERDENRTRKNRENGKMGGSPTLCSETIKEESVNPNSGIYQKPEARDQKLEENNHHQEAVVVDVHGGGRDRLDLKMRVAKAMGFDWRDAKLRLDFGRVDTWVADGFDEGLILEVVERVASSKKDGPPTTLRYFDSALARAKADRTAPIPTAVPRPRQAQFQRWAI